jgi:SAM-dependent methyltransferase
VIYESAKRALSGNPLYEAIRGVRVRLRAQKQEKLAETRLQYSAWLETKSDKERTVIDAVATCRVKGAKVLVVGANEGDDCRLFIEHGASEVHGVDVIEQIGRGFKHPRVHYHRAGIEQTGLEGNYFNLVFSVATMEHVGDIKTGFAEMARLTSPGGTLFSLAAPLWQSPYGHHMSCFEGHPWAHLVYNSRDALVAYARSHGIEGERGHPIEGIVGYMLNPEFFNMKPGNEFVEACSSLERILVQRNELVALPDSMLEHPLGRQALRLGFAKQDLLGEQHAFVGHKT